MNLKAIEIAGFKSFANRVKLEFPRGITAIVGPNGCGKTNVIEAVRWVLGEQNIRTLRGERMEEVIFNGTAQRKPLGMAEVRLSFSDPEQKMGLEAEEFYIGRQIFRSGESNYYINTKSCRLKDVQDLFMDTGMGSNAYSMIEQRMVEAVLSDRAEERRFLFEEAAGIQKYKLRRKFALRKLEATEGDLQRINDIVGEVQRTVNSLSRQVRKARNYKRLDGKLRRVAVTLARDELARLAGEEQPLTTDLHRLQDELARLAAVESTHSARSEELQTRITDRQRSADQLFERLDELNRSIRQAEDELTVSREKRAAGQEWIAEGGQRLESLEKNIAGRNEELAGYREQVEALRRAVGECEQEHSAASRGAREKFELVMQARRVLTEAQSRREELLQRAAGCASKVEALEDAAFYEKKRAADLAEKSERLAEEQGRLEAAQAAQEEKLRGLQEERRVLQRQYEELQQELNVARTAAETLKEKLSRAGFARDRLDSERELLVRLQKAMEGFGEGVRTLFSAGAGDQGLEGVAAEIFSTEARYERAVEAALGLRLQSIVARDTGAVLGAIRYLKEKGAGSATFISRDLVNGYRAQNGRIEGPVIAYCDQVVRCDGRYEFLRELLFKGVAIVEDLPTAIELQKKSDHPLHLVTLAGETVCQYAVSSGSSGEKQSGAALLQRKRRVEEIAAEIEAASASIGTLEHEFSEASVVVGRLERDSLERREALGALEESLGGMQAAVTGLSLQAGNARAGRETAEAEAAEALEKADQLAAERDEMIGKAESARAELEQLGARVEEAAGRLAKSEEASRAEGGALQEISLRLAGKKASLGEVEKSYSLLERECQAASAECRELAGEIEKKKALLEELERRESELRDQLEELFGERGGLDEEKEKFEAALSELRSELGEIEKQLRSLRVEKETATEARHKVEMELERISSRKLMVLGRMKDSFGVEMAGLEQDFPFFPNEEEREAGQQATPELAAELQERIRRLGPVNVLALEEFEKEKERLDFLQQQRDDLAGARYSLLRLIEEINKTARERFLDTFTRVQNNFQDIFTSLFEGGQAHVSLADESDPLESPIEVIARPRGKKMLGLGLLSGGEKALTALALLFAIYSVKPSPFCILDEADAPLDDANIDRFLTIIRRYSENTQFVIVTHNKRTMESADRLYGVTMQEAGVSKVVSVQLGQIAEDGRLEYVEDEAEKAS